MPPAPTRRARVLLKSILKKGSEKTDSPLALCTAIVHRCESMRKKTAAICSDRRESEIGSGSRTTVRTVGKLESLWDEHATKSA